MMMLYLETAKHLAQITSIGAGNMIDNAVSIALFHSIFAQLH